MKLPDSYTLKPGSIPAYFDAILQADAPERFSIKFLEGLEFKSTNDRLLVGLLKDLGFLDTDAVPTKRYFEFLDRSQSRKVLATAIRDAFADLFALNKDAHKLSADEAKNKLRSLYAGSKEGRRYCPHRQNVYGTLRIRRFQLCPTNSVTKRQEGRIGKDLRRPSA